MTGTSICDVVNNNGKESSVKKKKQSTLNIIYNLLSSVVLSMKNDIDNLLFTLSPILLLLCIHSRIMKFNTLFEIILISILPR